ncbi:MAG TPA: hypothetical protein VF800_21820 [Telluria sp.]|jgi:predicted transcriptional regulator
MEPDADKSMIVLVPADLADQREKLVQAIKEGIAEASRGEFASVTEVHSYFAKYGA